MLTGPKAAIGLRQGRLVLLGVILLAVTSLVVGRTLWLQLGGPTRWSKRARQQQTVNLTEPPKRGRLLDREGRVIVDHVPRFLLRADLGTDDKPDAKGKAGLPVELDKILKADDLAALLQGRSVLLDNAVLPRVSELVTRSKGLSLQEFSSRSYPQGSLACHAVGYIREEEMAGTQAGRMATIGVDGLEAIYEDRLRGTVGTQTQLVSATGVPLGLIAEVSPQDGPDLVTSLDLNLQRVAEQALDEAAQRLAQHPNRRASAPSVALLIDINSGEILVMACRPAFSPVLFQRADEKLAALLADPRAPLVNRAIAGTYPPASTFKLVTSAAVLKNHPEWAKEAFYCSGSRTIGETVFHCFVTSGHGSLTFEEAVAVSCDTVFYDLATRMPVEELVATAHDLGFGRLTGIDLLGESPGLLPSPETLKEQGQPWYAGDSANLGIGQGYMLATPLQVLTATARLLGNPKLEPRMLKGSSGLAPATPDPSLEPLWDGARGAVLYGTAAGISVDGLELAGKTGTAEAPTTEDNPLGLNHCWFVGWGPAAHPQVVALAFFEGSGGYGGEVAGPVVGEMLKAWKQNQEKKKLLQNDGQTKEDSGVSLR